MPSRSCGPAKRLRSCRVSSSPNIPERAKPTSISCAASILTTVPIFAIKLDGMPVNMPTHGHGQGYADINFLIPRLQFSSVHVRKGPYYADVGDLAAPPARVRDRLPQQAPQIISPSWFSFGSFGHRRGVAAGSTAFGCGYAARSHRGHGILQRTVGHAGQCPRVRPA